MTVPPPATSAAPLARRRRVAPLPRIVAALLVTFAAVLVPARASIAAAAAPAGPGLILTSDATYTVAPSARVVHVAIDVTARNTKPNRTSGGILTRYFYDGMRLGIQTEARDVAAHMGATSLTTTVEPADGYQALDVRFHSSLFYNQTVKVRVTYDLPSGAPRSLSDIRVGTAFVTFTAWAFGDRGTVRVNLPSSFDAESTGADATKTTSGATTSFRATNIEDVNTWYLTVTADRKSALTSERIDLAGGEHLVIRAWPEDTDWSDRVRELMTNGLPELVADTGLDWPVSGDIDVFEVHTPLLEGYSGQYYPGQDRIEVSEDLDDLTILHEASHAWFNNALFLSRWINEGFADTYAAEALRQTGQGEFHPDRINPSGPDAVRLDAWVHPGRIDDPTTERREQYGYEASWTVIRALFTEIGTDRMRQVLDAAEHRQIAYVGGVPAETIESTNDWHRLLDLVEGIGGSTKADELFRQYVLSPETVGSLDARAAARSAYAALVTAGGDWLPPFYVRKPMSDWQFDVATARIAEATAVLAKRDDLAKVVTALGLTAPPALRDAYQTATDSLAAADAIASSELAAANALTAASTAVAAERAPFVALGLWGEQPEASLAAARDAFSRGAPDAEAKAVAVAALIAGALEVGRGRALTIALAIASATILLIVVVLLVVRRRRRRGARALAFAPADGSAQADGPADGSPYATLADPDTGPEPPPVEHGDDNVTEER